MNYANTILMDSTTTYPAGEVYDRIVVLEDATFSTLAVTWDYGNTGADVTETELSSASEGFVLPGIVTDLALSAGVVLLSRG